MSSDLTDRRLYLRATSPRRQAEVAKGDVVQLGIMVSNSDVGAGSLRVEPFIVRLVCLNGMVMEHALRKAHLGRNIAMDEGTVELLSDATLRLGEAAFFAEVRDVVRACLEPAMFTRQVEKLQAATQQKITNYDLAQVVELTCKKVGVQTSQTVRASIVDALASGNQGAGLTKWGLANAFTAAAAHDEVDFDAAVELERAGAQVIDLAAGAWREVAEKKHA